MKNETMSSMRYFLYLFGLLALPVQAASFDCGKATTKIEKLICGDAKLSKLDEELNMAYKNALQDERRSNIIKQQQKQWMKERNDCPDAICVKRAYETRLLSLKFPYASSDDSVSTNQAVPSYENVNWHCELESTPQRIKNCEEIQDAKPYHYEIKLALSEKGYGLCELMLANMQALSEPMSCEFKISPSYQKNFSLPEWTDIDPWADIDLLWKVDVESYGFGPVYEARKKLTKEQWLEQFKRELLQANTMPIMRRARFDLNGDGKEDWVLAYQYKWNEPCNPWRGRQGYKLFVLSEDGKSLGQYADVSGGQVPFFFNSQDPRFPGTHTYRFMFYDARGGAYVTTPGQIEIYGSASKEGVERNTVCDYDLYKSHIQSIK